MDQIIVNYVELIVINVLDLPPNVQLAIVVKIELLMEMFVIVM